MNASRILKLALRDGVVVALAIALWAAPPDGALLAVLAALATTLVGYLLHEWGHLLGALAAGARFELPANPFESPFLFKFDRIANTRRQFFTMALGGFAASIATVLLLVAVLPREGLATWLTLGLVGAGVLATLVIEVPEFWRVWRGGPIPDGAAFVSASGSPED